MSKTTELNTATTELPYEGTPDSLRLQIARQAQKAQKVFSNLGSAKRPLSDAEKVLQTAAMHTAGYGWSIAALLGWLKKEHGEDVMWSAAAIVEDMLINGDSGWCDDLPQELTEAQP